VCLFGADGRNEGDFYAFFARNIYRIGSIIVRSETVERFGEVWMLKSALKVIGRNDF
jgi:hypothetical protein